MPILEQSGGGGGLLRSWYERFFNSKLTSHCVNLLVKCENQFTRLVNRIVKEIDALEKLATLENEPKFLT